MMQQAEMKKQTVRQKTEEMREEYKRLQERNSALPAHIQLHRKVDY